MRLCVCVCLWVERKKFLFSLARCFDRKYSNHYDMTIVLFILYKLKNRSYFYHWQYVTNRGENTQYIIRHGIFVFILSFLIRQTLFPSIFIQFCVDGPCIRLASFFTNSSFGRLHCHRIEWMLEISAEYRYDRFYGNKNFHSYRPGQRRYRNDSRN